MAEARTFEEYLYGPDGDERNLLSAIRQAVEEAKNQEIVSLRVRCQLTPTGTTSSFTDWQKVCPTSATPEALLAALSEALLASPGEAYSGKIRISFEESGNSGNRVGSYSRMLRPGAIEPSLSTDTEGNPIRSHTGSLKSHTDDAIRPHVEMTLRTMDRTVAIIHAAAHLLSTAHPAAPQPATADSGGGGMLPDLLRGAVGMAAAAGGQGQGQAQPQQAAHGFMQAATAGAHRPAPGRPPSPIPFSPTHRAPSPFTTGTPSYDGRPLLPAPSTPKTPRIAGPVAPAKNAITGDDVKKWAEQNPDQARAMIMQAIAQGHQ